MINDMCCSLATKSRDANCNNDNFSINNVVDNFSNYPMA